MITKDYYNILGVSKTASEEELRKAYREKARSVHPDVNKDTDAEEKFKEVSEAYEVLKNPKKRELYDLYGSNWRQAGDQAGSGRDHFYSNYGHSGPENGQGYSYHFRQGPGETADINDILRNLFGSAGGFSEQSFDDTTSYFEEVKTPARQEVELEVSLKDLSCETVKHLALEVMEPDDTGSFKRITKTLKVKIPAGLTDGSLIRLSRNKLAEKGVATDLYVRLNLAADPRFTVDGFNLKTAVVVSPWEAALGMKVPVETIDGRVTLTVPKNSQNGKLFRLKGKGLRKKNGDRGDILVGLKVFVPEELSLEEEGLLRELAEKSAYNPREHHQQRGLEQL